MSDKLHKILAELGDTINQEIIDAPAPALDITDRSISGNKINGGKIANFASTGIKDNATYAGEPVLTVENDKIIVDSISTNKILNPLQVDGNLKVKGEITAHKLHVDEITSDVRHERTTPLEFKGENNQPPYNKGLIWSGAGPTRQLMFREGEDRFFSSESIDLQTDKDYKINNTTVLSETELGTAVVKSNLRRVGTLQTLKVAGNLTVGEYLFWDNDSMRLGIGIDAPNGDLSIGSMDHEFIIAADEREFKVGTWSTSNLKIVTDDTTRISIAAEGNIQLNDKVSIIGTLGIGVKNYEEDVALTTAGPIRIQNKKMEVGDQIPTQGNYAKGDIIWNNNPVATSYVGWICIRGGTPGEWKTFGQISS